jgi:hypothetical protein
MHGWCGRIRADAMFTYLKEELAAPLASGAISVRVDVDAVFGIIGKHFPIGLNRIAWEKAAPKRRLEILSEPREIESGELCSILAAYKETIREWFAEEGIDPANRALWVGDDTDVALAMTTETLVEYFPVLFSFPQHSYALPEGGTWCLNYVMEGELLFAQATA